MPETTFLDQWCAEQKRLESTTPMPGQPGRVEAVTKLESHLAALHAHWRDSEPSVKVYLSRVRLDSQGYDSAGAYWGRGAPLYYAESKNPDDELSEYVRAYGRDDAKAALRNLWRRRRNLTFFR